MRHSDISYRSVLLGLHFLPFRFSKYSLLKVLPWQYNFVHILLSYLERTAVKTLVPEFSQPYRITRATCSSYQGPAGIGDFGDESSVIYSAFLLCILSFTKRVTRTKLEALTFLVLNFFFFSQADLSGLVSTSLFLSDQDTLWWSFHSVLPPNSNTFSHWKITP